MEQDLDNIDYGGVSIYFDAIKMKFRKAKITPKKTGQFVTLWKKNSMDKNEPYHIKNDFDYYIIATKADQRFGFFFFPRHILGKHNILSKDNQIGKMGFRVYPDWDNPTNRQAIKTKQWQSDYFIEITGLHQSYLDKFKAILT